MLFFIQNYANMNEWILMWYTDIDVEVKYKCNVKSKKWYKS